MTQWNILKSAWRGSRILRVAALFFTLAFLVRLAVVPAVFADPEEAGSRRIASEVFIESAAGASFQQGEYSRALTEIEALLTEYPGDPLLLRYKAMALDRSGDSSQSIAILEQLLHDDPALTPARFFLGQAYSHAGRREEAVREWNSILATESTGVYRHWAETALGTSEEAVLAVPEASQPVKAPRWDAAVRYGYEYDSNVILKPDDRTVASPGDQNAGRQTIDATLRYRAYVDRDTAVDVFIATRHTFHDDSLNEFNFHSEEFGIQGRQRVQLGRYDVVLGLRYDLLVGFLDNELFSLRNVWNLSADTRFTPQTRTVAYSRSTAANYGPDGFAPGTTSRDGYYQDLGVIQYWYSKDFSRYFYFKQELNGAMTRGDNFDTLGWTSRAGVHTPVWKRLSADVSTGLGFGFYPNFSSLSARDASRRRDVEGDIYTALTYQITRDLAVRAFYRFIDAWNQNNFYDYTRHIGGTQLIYSKKF